MRLSHLFSAIIWSICCSNRGHPRGLVNVGMLKFGVPYFHVTPLGKIDQPYTNEGSVHVEAKLSDCWEKDTFPPKLRIKMVREIMVFILVFSIERIFNNIALFFLWGRIPIPIPIPIPKYCDDLFHFFFHGKFFKNSEKINESSIAAPFS